MERPPDFRAMGTLAPDQYCNRCSSPPAVADQRLSRGGSPATLAGEDTRCPLLDPDPDVRVVVVDLDEVLPRVEGAQHFADGEGRAPPLMPAVQADGQVVAQRADEGQGQVDRDFLAGPLHHADAKPLRLLALPGLRARRGLRPLGHRLLHDHQVVLDRSRAGGPSRENQRQQPNGLHLSSYSIQIWTRSPSSPSMLMISVGPSRLRRSQKLSASYPFFRSSVRASSGRLLKTSSAGATGMFTQTLAFEPPLS